MNVSFSKYAVPTGLHSDFCSAFYQYVVPTGTVPAGLYIGRIKNSSVTLSPVGTEYSVPNTRKICSLL